MVQIRRHAWSLSAELTDQELERQLFVNGTAQVQA
jgi:hypothetical protein